MLAEAGANGLHRQSDGTLPRPPILISARAVAAREPRPSEQEPAALRRFGPAARAHCFDQRRTNRHFAYVATRHRPKSGLVHSSPARSRAGIAGALEVAKDDHAAPCG